MAMNKKEQAAFAAALRAARVAGALRSTAPVPPDVPPPAVGGGGGLAKGWTYNVASVRVNTACSSAVHHNSWGDKATNAQGPLWMHSTKVRALRALRHAMEQDFARRLADVDELIDAEPPTP